MNANDPDAQVGWDQMTRKYELLARFVSQVGFPIVVAAFLLWRLDNTLIGLSENVRALTVEQREANTLMRSRIEQFDEETSRLKRIPPR